jgi:hypothetical protein
VVSGRHARRKQSLRRAGALGLVVGVLVAGTTFIACSFLPVPANATTDAASSLAPQTLKAASTAELTFAADTTADKKDFLAAAPMPDLEVTVSQTAGLVSQAVDVSWKGAVPSSGTSNFLQIMQCWGDDPANPGHPDRTTCQAGGFGQSSVNGSTAKYAARDGQAECTGVHKVAGKNVWDPPSVNPMDVPYTTGKDDLLSTPCKTSNFQDNPVTAIPFREYSPDTTEKVKVASRVFPDPLAASNPSQVRSLFHVESANSPCDITASGTTTHSTYNGVQPALSFGYTCGGYFSLPKGAKVMLPGADGKPTLTDANVTSVDMTTTSAYTKYNTNEVPWAGSSLDGVGSTKFEIQTNTEAPWLGCGSPVTDPTTSVPTPKSCWLVVIPRGTHDLGTSDISKPGLWWDAWQHHLAFRINFKPTAQRCGISGTERHLAGTELLQGAISSWQPKLCGSGQASAFTYSVTTESLALSRAKEKTTNSALAFTSRATEGITRDPTVYAPVALTGVVVTFAIDRLAAGSAPSGFAKLDGKPFESMKLTPRLVAKLLTNSYNDSLPQGQKKHIGAKNATALLTDPDFQKKQDTQEWTYQNLTSPSLADLLTPGDPSDSARMLWAYAMSDQEGRDFLAGKPDEQGMVVNPYYSTVSQPNPYYVPANPATKTAAVGEPTLPANVLPLDSFPKADPIATENHYASNPSLGNDSINLLTYRPYTAGFADGAYLALRGDGKVLNTGEWDTQKLVWKKIDRDLPGRQKVLAVASAEASARYHTVTASLRNPAGEFVAPTPDSMLAAANVMTPQSQGSSVLGLDFSSDSTKSAKTAYPLTMPVYAAINPLQPDKAALTSYANVIRYAVTDGQTPGVAVGQLPAGYAPIPNSWKDQALKAATAIEQGISPLSVLTVTPRSIPTLDAVAAAPSLPSSESAPSPTPSQSSPSPSGAVVTSLAGKPTPQDPVLGPVAVAVPAGMISGLAAAAGVPLYTRFRRRL